MEHLRVPHQNSQAIKPKRSKAPGQLLPMCFFTKTNNHQAGKNADVSRRCVTNFAFSPPGPLHEGTREATHATRLHYNSFRLHRETSKPCSVLSESHILDLSVIFATTTPRGHRRTLGGRTTSNGAQYPLYGQQRAGYTLDGILPPPYPVRESLRPGNLQATTNHIPRHQPGWA